MSEPEPPAAEGGPRSGPCLNGPLAGQQITTRYPKGALLVDRPAAHVWIYDWTPDGFRSRSGDDPLPLSEDPDADDNRWRAADEADYDVMAAPWIGDADQVDAYAGDNEPADPDTGDDTGGQDQAAEPAAGDAAGEEE